MKQSTKDILNKWLIVPFLGSVVIAFFTELGPVRRGEWHEYIESLVVSFTYWSLLANGNDYFICQIDKRYSWLEAPVTRAVLGLITMFLVTMVISTVVLYVLIVFYFGYDFIKVWEHDGFAMYIIPVSITLVISLWLHGKNFLDEWRQAAIDVEKLKTENAKSKFESLRSQVNPHFLFNSLNALSTLVYADQAKAVEFIQKLSGVYRYVLEQQSEEVVEVQKELDFLKSFAYLNSIRFGDNFKVEYTGFEDQTNGFVPPVVLQMLVENCIKHNEISKEYKLSIQVRKEGETIVVENNINPLDAPRVDSNGLGLSNIVSRYEMLSDRKVEIEHTKESFIVKLPILELS